MKATDEINELLLHKDYESMIGHQILYHLNLEPSSLKSDQQKFVYWSKVIDISPSGKCVKLIDMPCKVDCDNEEYYRLIDDIILIEVLPL